MFKEYKPVHVPTVKITEVTWGNMLDLAMMFGGHIEGRCMYLPEGKRFREGDLINSWGNHVLGWNWDDWVEVDV